MSEHEKSQEDQKAVRVAMIAGFRNRHPESLEDPK